ncbi:endonuclease/exonuclease/phosphatase family protein [Dysgonomonas sp. HDW5A]|uniref:endonuclease/exonuclease/phosphatase family protein n=1 Tax=Dysgonomonas sp. HDW5A TaxID=2714926 RepID=UPI0014072B5E|nr:endonuclease/exonuclease/phosphatase family protein [Dysgonomonas sp. HDW5A]QIK60954.1 endonuclease/exonuclease/phosphatase family protein [Dysgonomonas sp. HDW5A]
MKNLIYILLASLLISCGSKPLELNVMSYNIRYDNPEDSLNNWQYRKDVAAKIIQTKDIDIVGTQEVLHNQLVDLQERLPEYTAIGVGRQDGIEKGEYSALFYKKDRFSEVSSGYFWLSETPEVAGSIGWDGACERIATWAILKDKQTGKEVFAINTHLDHVGKIARQEGVTLLLTRAAELSKGLPIIMTGDFNAPPDSDVIKHVTNTSLKEHLTNAKTIAKEFTGTEWTFHDFGKIPVENRDYIDYIFVSNTIETDKFEVLPEKLDGVFLSDHVPVVAKIKIK